MLTESFADLFVGAQDTATHRVCGSCGELKPVEAFYKDGKDSHGNPKYRRDCRECYKRTRVYEAKMKRRQQQK
jgi:hypothetical protein